MKFSKKELEKLFVGKLQLSTDILCDQLTMLGLEVEDCKAVAPPFSGVLIGKVVEAQQHPNADRLQVCQVSIDDRHPQLLNIVCGAPNARAGIKVAVATMGAILPGNFTIKETKLRGELSQGMLCSEKELGLPETNAGILELPFDAPVGMNLRDYLDLDDEIIAINLTPNRGDCLSLIGIARELAVKNDLEWRNPTDEIKKNSSTGHADLKIDIHVPAACPRYFLAEMSDIDNALPTPREIKQRLERGGIRSISLIVDILNDVMLLIGQPLHAFDADQLEGATTVAFAKAGESIQLLNDTAVTLRQDTLTIRDQRGPVAIAGIMGGKSSAVTVATSRILIESAFFSPLALAGQARSYGLHTDASHRFERGVDPSLPETAMSFAVHLIRQYAGGRLTRWNSTHHTLHLPHLKKIILNFNKVERVLGYALQPDLIKKTLQALHCNIVVETSGAIQVTPPGFRFDLEHDIDLIEELARIEGYGQHDPGLQKKPGMTLFQHFMPEQQTPVIRLKELLCASGLHEVVTYSFMDVAVQQQFFPTEKQYILSNPISKELAGMRKSIIPNLLNTLKYNLNRQQTELAVFEVGECFVVQASVDKPEQVTVLAGLIYGRPSSWYPQQSYDFYDLKGLIEKIFTMARLPIEFKTLDLPEYLHPGQAQTLWHNTEYVGYFGAVHPRFFSEFDLTEAAFLFELSIQPFQKGAAKQARPFSKFPMIERDLAFLVDRHVPAACLVETAQSVRAAQRAIVQDVTVFDVYEGQPLPPHQKSIAIKIHLQALDRTLTEAEVETVLVEMIKKIIDKHQATLRERA